jgi:hypothetical protein
LKRAGIPREYRWMMVDLIVAMRVLATMAGGVFTHRQDGW